nr:uncharacterized protein LOC129257981 [Lytechinus pictus]
MAGLQLSLLWGCLIICSLTHVVSGAAMTCHSIVGAGLRCRWPDEGLECACIPNAECLTGTNVCQCLPGYTGPECERSCPYDDNGQCLTQCVASPYCDALSSCRQEEGACMCREGYSGKDCNLCDHTILPNCSQCPYQKCENGGKCDLVIRRCACEDGYQGDSCSLCYPSLHPNGCGEHCDLTCVNAYCNTHTGDCSCPHGFDVEEDCSFCDPYRVADHCQRFCHTICRAGGLCNVAEKRCMCKDGYVGDDCRLCDPRVHPEKCVEHCPSECQNNGYCDVVTGYCLCQPGYEVTYNCGLCRPSLHSGACVNHCDPQCRNGGDCLSSQGLCMCPVGYIHHDCSVCMPGLQARNCTDHCPLCDNNATCDTITGQCICEAGWHGASCSDPCPEDTYGLNCQLRCDCGIHLCDPISGTCIIQTTTPQPTTTTIPPTTTTVVTTTTAAVTTVAPTTSTSTKEATTPRVTTTVITTTNSTTGPLNVVELSSTKKQDTVTISAGAGLVPTQQSPEEIASLAPGLILEKRQPKFSSTYVIAIVISAIILIVLLSLLIFYLIYDRRKRKRQLPEAMPEEIPLNNVVTNNLENGRSSNIYIDGILPILSGEQTVDGTLPDPACCNRKSLTQEQVQRLSRISGDMAFFAKVPNALAESKNPNLFKEAKKDKFGLDDGEVKPNNNDQGAPCKAGGCEPEDDGLKAKCHKGDDATAGGVQDELMGACGGVEPSPAATSTPMKPVDRNSRIYEEVILTHDPTENRNPRMSGEYYLLEPIPAWQGSSSTSSENDSAKALPDDRSSQSSNPRRSADSGIEQAAASLVSPHYEQLERPLDFAQPRSPTLSRTEKSDDERDSGVYAHLSRAPTAKGYNRLEFSPRRKRKPDVEFFSENHYRRLKADANDDDSLSD